MDRTVTTQARLGTSLQVIANQKELIPICSPAIMTVFEFPPRLSLSRNVNTESLYGTNSFFRKDGRLDVVEELMEFSAKREINTTCISCLTDVWRDNKKDAREQKRTREGAHLAPIRSLQKNFRSEWRGRLSGEGLLSNLAPRSRDLALAHGFSRHPLSCDQAFFGLLRQEV